MIERFLFPVMDWVDEHPAWSAFLFVAVVFALSLWLASLGILARPTYQCPNCEVELYWESDEDESWLEIAK